MAAAAVHRRDRHPSAVAGRLDWARVRRSHGRPGRLGGHRPLEQLAAGVGLARRRAAVDLPVPNRRGLTTSDLTRSRSGVGIDRASPDRLVTLVPSGADWHSPTDRCDPPQRDRAISPASEDPDGRALGVCPPPRTRGCHSVGPIELADRFAKAARPAQREGEGEASSGWPRFPTIPKVPSGRNRSQARPMRKLAGSVPNARESADTPR